MTETCWQPAEPYPGAQLRVDRGAYKHHGVYVGDDSVVHYAADDGDGVLNALSVTVRRSTLSEFLRGGNLEVRRYTAMERLQLRPAQQIVKTALVHIGEGGYDLLRHNCEDFSNECAFGKRKSGQIDAYREQVRALLKGSADKKE